MQIELENYPVYMRLGCYRTERLVGQEVLISAVLDIGSVPLQDDLAVTLDYAEVVATFDEVLQSCEVKLLEYAIMVLGKELLQRYPMVQKALISIEKPVLPENLAKGGRVRVSEQFLRGNQK